MIKQEFILSEDNGQKISIPPNMLTEDDQICISVRYLDLNADDYNEIGTYHYDLKVDGNPNDQTIRKKYSARDYTGENSYEFRFKTFMIQ